METARPASGVHLCDSVSALLPPLFLGGCASLVQVKCVSIRDDKFEVVKELAPADLSEFQRQWSEKAIAKVSLSDVGGMHFKLDVGRGGSGERWLYQTTGYVQVLSKQESPVYKLPDPEAFNRLIGATK
jgi:hypothetical protein